MKWLEYPIMLLFILLLIAFAVAGQISANELESEAQARASLALHRAAKQRFKSLTSPIATPRVQSDQSKLEEAWKEARHRGVPIVCWVAVRADDYPEFHKSLGDVVHVELTSNEGSSKPRVLFVRSDKLECVAFCSEKGIRDDTAKKMWEIYRGVMGLPVSKSLAPQQVGYARPVVIPFVGGYKVSNNCST